MKPLHIAMAVCIAAIWGFNFVMIVAGLKTMSPLTLAGARFVVAAIPVLWLPRPRVPWGQLIAIAMTLFVVQFGVMFTAIASGMPAGLSSIVIQSQAIFTAIIAAVFLGERPTWRQMTGMALAAVGLGVIGTTAGGGGFTLAGLALTLISALGWSVGNVLLRRAGKVDVLAMMAWLSLIPPLPLFGLSILLEGGAGAFIQRLAAIDTMGVIALLYIGAISTLVGYGLWGRLLTLYPASTVAPFALLVPPFGVGCAALFLGERFGSVRLAGMLLVFAGLGLIAARFRGRAPAPAQTVATSAR